MDRYRMAAAPAREGVDEVIYATHPAQPGTYIMYVQKDGTTHREPVLCWGILDDCTVIPLTLSGAWDSVSNQNNCVLHADGSCGKYEQSWPTVEAAIEDLREFGE